METRAATGTVLPTDDLDDFLVEFDRVVQDFEEGRPSSQYEHHLEELKRKKTSGATLYDSGIDDSESNSTSPRSSLNTSEEDLNTPATVGGSCPKAKLGETRALEEFIAELDRALEEM